MFRSHARRDAFETIVAQYDRALLAGTARLLGDPSAAEDLVQDVFIRLAARWKGEMVPSPQMTAWLNETMHNMAVDVIRRRARQEELHRREALERGAVSPPGAGDGEVSDDAAAAAEALAALDERERRIVVLKVYEEKSYREIADETGLTVGNVGFILHAAMKKLAAKLSRLRPKAEGDAR